MLVLKVSWCGIDVPDATIAHFAIPFICMAGTACTTNADPSPGPRIDKNSARFSITVAKLRSVLATPPPDRGGCDGPAVAPFAKM